MRWSVLMIVVGMLMAAPRVRAQETPEEYAKVLGVMAEDFVASAARGDAWKEQVRRTHYSESRLLEFSQVTFRALEYQGIGAEDLDPWLANVAGNVWAQTKLSVVASTNNVVDGKKLDCTKLGFDTRCDYGPIQLNGGQVLRLWRECYHRPFRPEKDFHKLFELPVIMHLSVAYLVEQATGRHRDSPNSGNPLSCEASLERPGELRKAGCAPYVRHVSTLAGAPIEQVWRGPYCRKERCPKICHCAIMEAATGGAATAPGGSTLTAWWVWNYRLTRQRVLGGGA